ncbi:ABC transporter permease [Tundrisphaera lichenicola]|uniref:ABC transporter permease n=1 Tax=Tundrisphaera lichenicola TaxID=2029860 RepID=UPI003EBACC60
MIDLISIVLGPLAAPECGRASRRSWLIWVRMLPAIASSSVAFVILWIWWMTQQINPNHQPYFELRTGLSIVVGMLVAFAMILTPAVLAGSLAGDKERGSIGLLLTTRVNAAEIVLGRLAGRLSQVLMIELAAIPALLLFASLAGLGPLSTFSLIALPAGLALGGGGIALAASAMSRRGRDALLLVYLIEILTILIPMVAAVPYWVTLINPIPSFMDLSWADEPTPALVTAGVWSALGLLGLALASWRLRPACLAEGGDARSRLKARRKVWVPPLDDRPMLWKELYIERAGTLGKVGRWIGALLVIWLGLGSLTLGGIAAWNYSTQSDAAWADWAVQQLSAWYGGSALFLSFLIEWAIGLRAAVAISSERERGTWDALLTSPLEGSEIVRAKLWGSLHALRWLIGSALLAWTVSAIYGAMTIAEYLEVLAGVGAIGAFMAAAGVRTSLRSGTATRSMGVTMGLWLGAYLGSLALAWIVCVTVVVLCFIGWLMAIQMGLTTTSSRPWFPMSFRLGSDLCFYGQFLFWTGGVVAETKLRFDRVAGRMTAGTTAVAFDRLIHGKPMAPVQLERGARSESPIEPEWSGSQVE